MIPDSAFARAEHEAVLHPVSREDLDRAVVHLDGTRHDDLALRMGQDLPDARFQVESLGGAAEFLQHGVEHAVVVAHSVLVEIDPLVGGRPRRRALMNSSSLR